MSEAQAIGTTGVETDVTEVEPIAAPLPAPSAEEIIKNALEQAGVSDLSKLDQPQAEALLAALEAEQATQVNGQSAGQTKGLGELIGSLREAIEKWPSKGETALEKQLDRAAGTLLVLQALQHSLGSGSVGLAGEVDAALGAVGERAEALRAATDAINKQLAKNENADTSRLDQMPDEQQIRQELHELKDNLDRVVNEAGFTDAELGEMGITALRSELEQALNAPQNSGMALRKAELSALGNYLQGRVQAGELNENSTAVLRNSAIAKGLEAAGNMVSMNKAWESEVRSATNLESYTKENLKDAVGELKAMRQEAILRGDLLAASAIKSKMDAINKAVDGMGSSNYLGRGAMLLFMALDAIDLVTKNMIRNDLLKAKEDATSAGDEGLVSEIQGQIDALDTQTKAMSEHMTVEKQQMQNVMEDLARHEQEITKQAF